VRRRAENEIRRVFNLIYVKSDGDGRVVGHSTFCDMLSWQIVLAEAGGPKDIKVALASDPLNPVNWDANLASTLDIDFSWLNEPKRNDELNRTKEGMHSVIKQHANRTRESNIGRIVESVSERYGISDQNAPIPQDRLNAVVGEIIARSAAPFVGAPYEEKLTLEHLQARSRSSDRAA
jgi:hypothetical protein